MLTETELISRLGERGGIGPLKILGLESRVRASTNSRTQADLVLDLGWGDARNRFVVEVISLATPKMLELAIVQARRIQDSYPGCLPMIATPYLGPKSIKRLIEESMSGVDLAGNYVVIVPGVWFVTNSSEPNPFPANQPIKGIYEGTSSLVGRVLLSRPDYPRATDVKEEIERRGGTITKGTVSKVLTALEEDLIISRTPSIKLLRPEDLLHKLAENYRPPVRKARLAGRVPALRDFLRGMKSGADDDGINVIGRDEALYAVSPKTDGAVKLYISRVSPILDGLGFMPDERFPDVDISVIESQVPYFDPVEREQFPWCSRLQIYLELARGDAREQVIANEIKRDILMKL